MNNHLREQLAKARAAKDPESCSGCKQLLKRDTKHQRHAADLTRKLTAARAELKGLQATIEVLSNLEAVEGIVRGLTDAKDVRAETEDERQTEKENVMRENELTEPCAEEECADPPRDPTERETLNMIIVALEHHEPKVRRRILTAVFVFNKGRLAPLIVQAVD